MNTRTIGTINSPASSIATNRVLRNTYALLALTLLFSSVTAGITMALSLPHPGVLVTLAGYFGLLFLTTRFRNSGLGLAMVFALTGFMGYTLGGVSGGSGCRFP
jgi:modulator of FtsH protease